jgi:hypothetical protein
MPFVIGETINNMADYVLSSSYVLSIAKSPIYTSLIIATVIFFVILFVFRNVATDDYIGSMAFRASFWTFMAALVVLFLHNKVLMSEVHESLKIGEYEAVINSSAATTPNMFEGVDFTKNVG